MSQTSPANRAARRSLARKVALGLAIGLLLAALAYTGLFFVSGIRVEREIARLEQRFGSLGASSLVVDRVAPEDNRALVVREAAALIDREHSSTIGRSLNKYLTAASAFPVSVDARRFVERNRAAIRSTERLSSRTGSNFEADYLSANLPDLPAIRLLSDALYVAANMELEAGRLDAAAARVTSVLTLGASFIQEPALIMQLMRIAITTRAMNGLEDLITRAEPSRDSLTRIAQVLAENRGHDPMRIGFLGDLKLNVARLRRIDAGTAEAPDAYHYQGAYEAWTKGPLRVLGRPVHRLALVRYLQEIEQLIDLQAGPRPRPALDEGARAARWNLPERLADDLSAGLRRSLDSDDQFKSTLAATEIAVALRRYRLDHGAYPAELTALAPAYLPRVPIDPFTGQPPVYRRDGAGFTLEARNIGGVAISRSALTWAVPR